MLKEIAVLLICFLLLSACRVKPAPHSVSFTPDALKTGVQAEGLKGRVKTVRSITFEGKEGQKEADYTVGVYHGYNYAILFDPEGKVMETTHFIGEFTLGQYLQNPASGTNRISDRVVNEYDAKGNLIGQSADKRVMNYGLSSGNAYSYSYSKNRDTVFVQKSKIEREIRVFRKGKLQSIEIIGTSKNVYNVPSQVWTYTYYPDSVTETFTAYYNPEKTIINKKQVATYSHAGLLQRRVNYFYRDGEGKIDNVQTFRYDKGENLIEVASNLSLFNYQYAYLKFDRKGNWLIRKQISSLNNFITYREIEYY